MKVLIVEDEALAAEKLRRQLRELRPTLEVLASVPSARQAEALLRQQAVDLIFLDIQLEDGLSFQLFERLEVDTPIIFTTAYDEFALRAFEVNSLDYLLKPFARGDLEKALRKYERWRSQAAQPSFDYAALAQAFRQEQAPTYRQRFLVSVGEHFHTVPTEEVAYFFAAQKYVFLVRPDGQQHILDEPLDHLEQQLDPQRFYRINRKYLVQLSAIAEMVQWTKGRIKLRLHPPTSEETIVSVGRSAGFREWLGQ
jgi:two-component system, LytTR family, response regulator LytT